MKIVTISVDQINLPLAKPFVTSRRKAASLSSAVVKITTDTGHVGYGEAPSNHSVTGDTKEAAEAAVLNYISQNLIGREISDLESNMEILNSSMQCNVSAKAATDIALYDLWGQLYNAPLYKLLGGYKSTLKTDMTISVGTKMVEDAIKQKDLGFDTLKIKVGTGGLKDFDTIMDISKAVGDNISLRIDANQGWTAKEAVRIIKKLEHSGANIEFVEQPVNARDFSGMAFVTKNTMTDIAADESVFSPKDVVDILKMEAADIINIKLIKSGGIHNAIKICNIAESFGKPCMVGSMLESDLGAVAAAHFAASQKNVKYVDLDTPFFVSGRATQGGIIYNGKNISFSKGAGLGIEKLAANIEKPYEF